MTTEPATGILDLSGTRPLDSFVLQTIIPGTSQKSGWNIELAGPAHPTTIALGSLFGRETIEKEKAIEFAQVNGRKWKVDDEDQEDRKRKNVGRICGRILGWSPNPVFSFVQTEPIAFSVEAATNLFLRPDMARWLLQITEYLNGETAFTPPSGKT
ncbi:MAG: hypothetical protein Q8L13_11765 [Bradyrhizobium sp.]|uniref:hypothetical protein n=1 Tax=Bradyrhizobium sp. TaxID=376 RepID=UPI0027301A28|nr:hypothetical protein [Bradyrhizobium sp.]MDP1867002.1 hypothetical protein [Bradyrhizobium sp.]